MPFAINQLGGVAFSLLLGSANLLIVVPLVNSLTILWTGATAALLFGEREHFNFVSLLGVALVLFGIGVCIHSQIAVAEYSAPR